MSGSTTADATALTEQFNIARTERSCADVCVTGEGVIKAGDWTYEALTLALDEPKPEVPAGGGDSPAGS